MKIVVASKNPVKLNAARAGFESFFSDVEVNGVVVDSGVSDQPMSDDETLNGARKRAANARAEHPEADFWVGIEGGVHRDDNGLTAFAWIVVCGREITGESRTTTFRLPPGVNELIDRGYELGTANDMLFNAHNSKQQSGAVGLLTNNAITRTQLYVQAVQLALIPFLNTEMYSVNGR